MKLCPLLAKECIANDCEWFAGGINRCTIVALGMLSEGIHDMGVNTYNLFIKPEEEPVTE
jgi:hypothetical protein